MSRYIDADALKEKYTMVIKRYSGGIMERPAVLLETIDDAPSIDIVKCVDCRKCKEQGGHANCNGYLYCTRQKTMVDEDCFCSWGEER